MPSKTIDIEKNIKECEESLVALTKKEISAVNLVNKRKIALYEIRKEINKCTARLEVFKEYQEE